MTAPAQIDHTAIEERAAQWLVRREDDGWNAADQAELESWLDESMAHKAAYWRLEFAWREADRMGSLGRSSFAPVHRQQHDVWNARRWRSLAVAASLALVFVTGLLFLKPWSVPAERPGQVIATRVGGHTIVPLDDGSKIELNTATLIRASVTPERREVWLDKGEAYFEVKHSDKVPFVVHAGPRTITVLGTKFSVRRDGDKVTVSVVEGRVRVDEVVPEGTIGSSSTVTTGDVAIAEGSSTLVASKSGERVDTALAWRDGMLTFDQISLGEAAEEFNRYNERRIIIDDPEVAKIRIGGTFRASNADAFIRLLRDAYGLKVEVSEKEVRISN